jgi:hypothetical protein
MIERTSRRIPADRVDSVHRVSNEDESHDDSEDTDERRQGPVLCAAGNGDRDLGDALEEKDDAEDHGHHLEAVARPGDEDHPCPHADQTDQADQPPPGPRLGWVVGRDLDL